VLTNGAARFHETWNPVPKYEKPLRFAEFLKSRVSNGYIQEASQLGCDRVIRLVIQRGDFTYRVYIRLWGGAANVIVTDADGHILDCMRRLPKRGEITGGRYQPETAAATTEPAKVHECGIRDYDHSLSFNAFIDRAYAAEGAGLGQNSLDKLREAASKKCGVAMNRIEASLEKLREKAAEYEDAPALKTQGDNLMASLGTDSEQNRRVVKQAQELYERAHKAKSGLQAVKDEIARGEKELAEERALLKRLLEETEPLALEKLLRTGGRDAKTLTAITAARKRPGLSFLKDGWLILVGRSAAENDDLLRHYVKGGDLWLHARDVQGAYVFVKVQRNKTYPLDLLLDAGNLAIFYSKARNSGKGSLFYTQVKYLRRAKNGPKGLVLPTQEKNLDITLDEKRLAALEACKL
jgi:predicted ribosome quality control (RQC) complex YloA/Tae2 family protein